MRRALLCLTGFCLLLLGTLPAVAAEGRTPVYQPGPILTAGKYVVTRNIVGTIIIQAPDVDLDLNGFTVSGGGAPGPCIWVVPPSDHVVIRNGILAGGATCIDVPTGLPGNVRKIVIEDILCRDSTLDGIHLGDVESAVIRRVQVTAATAIGINWDGGPTKIGTIENSVIRRIGEGIYVLGASSLAVSHNTIDSTFGVSPVHPGYGIFVDQSQGALVSENTVENAAAVGIFFRTTYASKIFDNVVEKSAVHGIWLNPASFNNLVLNNVASNNNGAGLLVDSSGNLIEVNVLNGNANYGLWFTGCGNGFGGNIARGNNGALGGCAPLFPPNSCDVLGTMCNNPPISYVNSSNNHNLIPNLY